MTRYLFLLLSLLALPALASRNTAGNYTLPLGNPVVSGTVITSTWANATMGDLKNEMTNSLSRDGYGGMRAPLKVPDGSSVLPSLTFTSDPNSGLYLAGGNDVRMSVASTDVFKYAPAGNTSYAALSCEKGAVVTNSTANGAGLTTTGNGTGAGVVATGGATGNGLTASGGSTSGYGVQGTGTGSFAGVRGVGGANSPGLLGAGTGSGAGVSATGGATGPGASFTGGAAGDGVRAVGGGASASGIYATGGAGGVGAYLEAGTAATATTARYAATLKSGYLNFDATNPNSNVGFSKVLTPKNLVTVWANITATGTLGGSTVNDGFNISSVSISNITQAVTVTFASSFANSSYACVGSADSISTTDYVLGMASRTSSAVTFYVVDVDTGSIRSVYSNAATFSIICTGAQ